jgi:uncharacterized membrane protein YheB (UPF0754 family)
MAGIVGYFTNFLAIKMLFQPKQGKVLGWEGLVPKNKAKIAKSLGESAHRQLLSPDKIMNYIYEKDLLDKGLQKIGAWIDEIIHDKAMRSRVTRQIVYLLRENGSELLVKLFDTAETALKEWAKSPEEIQRYWKWVRQRLQKHLAEQQNRQQIADFVRGMVEKQIPRMADTLNEALEEYLSRKKAFGRIGLGFKKIISFHEEAMEELLYKFIQDPETTEQFLGTLDILVDEFENNLQDPETQKVVMERIETTVNQISEFSRQNMLDSSAKWLRDFLNDESNWDKIDHTTTKSLAWFKNWAADFVSSEQGQRYLHKIIDRMVHQVNVSDLVEEQVMKLDTDELETMILDNTGGNLVIIQVLGGSLGLIAGLIQVHHIFAFPVMALVGAAYIGYWFNQRKYANPTHQSDN